MTRAASRRCWTIRRVCLWHSIPPGRSPIGSEQAPSWRPCCTAMACLPKPERPQSQCIWSKNEMANLRHILQCKARHRAEAYFSKSTRSQYLEDKKILCQILGEKKFFARSEEHTSELQSLMRISYAVFCLKKKK